MKTATLLLLLVALYCVSYVYAEYYYYIPPAERYGYNYNQAYSNYRQGPTYYNYNYRNLYYD